MRYVKKQPEFESETHGKRWFIRVTINCCNNVFSAPWRKKVAELKEELVAEEKEILNLGKELGKLPVKYREVIHLFYYEDMSVDDISQTLGRKSSTVRTQLTRGREKLREFMKEEDYV